MTGVTILDAAREAARTTSGRFGVQHRPEASAMLSLPECVGCGSTFDVTDGYCHVCIDEELDDFDNSCEMCGNTHGIHDGICDACWEDEQDLAEVEGYGW